MDVCSTYFPHKNFTKPPKTPQNTLRVALRGCKCKSVKITKKKFDVSKLKIQGYKAYEEKLEGRVIVDIGLKHTSIYDTRNESVAPEIVR